VAHVQTVGNELERDVRRTHGYGAWAFALRLCPPYRSLPTCQMGISTSMNQNAPASACSTLHSHRCQESTSTNEVLRPKHNLSLLTKGNEAARHVKVDSSGMPGALTPS